MVQQDDFQKEFLHLLGLFQRMHHNYFLKHQHQPHIKQMILLLKNWCQHRQHLMLNLNNYHRHHLNRLHHLNHRYLQHHNHFLHHRHHHQHMLRMNL